MGIYVAILLLIGVLTLYSVNRNEMDELTELLGTSQGNWIFLHTFIPAFALAYAISWCISSTRGRHNSRMVEIIAVIVWYAAATLSLKSGIPVLSLEGIIGGFLGTEVIMFFLMTIMNLAGLPSRNIVLCHRSDVHRKKTGYWWY